MRIEGSVTAISWIPSEAIEGLPKLPFELGVGHYDEPPPDRVSHADLGRLRDEDRFREANLLRAWIEVEDGKVVKAGYGGGGLVGSTTFRLGPKAIVVPGVPFEVLRAEPEVSADRARFVQTVGGRAGFPAPRLVKGGPMFRIHSATAWTTLALTLHADGRIEHELVGASPFPRHWIYDSEGGLAQKSGTVDFKKWYRESHGEHTPWGDEESDAVVTAAETVLERELSQRAALGRREAREARISTRARCSWTQGAEGRRALSASSTASRRSRSTASRSPRWGPGRCSASAHRSRAASARRRCARSRRCRVAVIPAELVAEGELATLATDRRRED